MKIDFTVLHPSHGTFSDALHLSDDHALTDAEIEALKQERFDNWVLAVEAPPSDTIEFDGAQYAPLEGVPPSGAILKEFDGVWYYKV